MAIKIPSAAELGVGRRTPGAIPEGTPRPVPKIRTGVGLEIAQGLTQLAGLAVSGLAAKEAEAARLDEKNRIKIEKATALRQKTEANNITANIFGKITEATDALVNADLNPDIARKTFNQTMEGIRGEFEEQIPRDLQEQYRPQFIKAHTRAKSRFASSVSENVKHIAIAKGAATMDVIAQGVAANPDSRDQAKQSVSTIIDGLPIDADKKVVLKAKKKAEIDSVAVTQLLTERDGGLYRTELDGLIEDLKAKNGDGQFVNFNDLPPASRANYIDQAERARIVDENSKRNVFVAETKNALSKYKELVLAGFPIPPEAEAILAQRVKGTEFEQAFKDIKAEGSSLEFVAKKYTENPLEFGAARLGIEIEPLDLGDPARLGGQLLDRVTIGKAVQGSIGGSFAPILTSEEIKQVGALMDSDMSAAISLVDGITGIVGGDTATGIAMQMGNLDPDKATILRAVADGDLKLADDLVNGQELVKTRALKMPKPLETEEWFWDEAGRSLHGYPNNGNEAKAAYHSLYAAEAQRRGVQDGEFDDDIAEMAFKRAVGEVENVNGFRTIIQTGIDEIDLREGIRRIRGEFIAASGGIDGMDDAEAARAIRDDGQFYSAGPNIYRVRLNGQVVMTKQGFPLQFDVSGLKDRPPEGADTGLGRSPASVFSAIGEF